MKSILAFLCFFLLLSTAVPRSSAICLPNLNNALVDVIGQLNVVNTLTGSALNQLNGPTDVVVDAISGAVFVLDQGNQRILRFNSHLNILGILGICADAVVFGNGIAACASVSLNNPSALAILNKTLFVADTLNHRILRFVGCDTGSLLVPNLVLGQISLDVCVAGNLLAQLNLPQGLAIDIHGNVWVADFLNHRILKFTNAVNLDVNIRIHGKIDVEAHANVLGIPIDASLVIGTGRPGCASNILNGPIGLSIDLISGALFVADSLNHRVLVFKNAPLLEVHADVLGLIHADVVIGQPDFLTSVGLCAKVGLNLPTSVLFDPSSATLFVSDALNNRIAIFKNALDLINGCGITQVIGQVNATVCLSLPCSKFSLSLPWGLALDIDLKLIIADRGNNRILRASCPGGLLGGIL